MRAVAIVHGPEAVDTGLALRVIGVLEREHEVRCVMSGCTGAAAVVDAGLEDRIDISEHHVPSATIRRLAPSCDLIVLVNSAKDIESALRFGGIVSARAGDVRIPLIQIDAAMVLPWNGAVLQAISLAEALDMPMIVPERVADERREGWRRIGGVRAGESVWVNGVVVGKATSKEVWISCREGRLVAEGMALKETGVRRLGDFILATAHVRSGSTRRTSALPRQAPHPTGMEGRFVDHSAEAALTTCRGAAYAVTVGDDTSRNAAALLYRFGVKVIAITDGDEDGICSEDVSASGSVEMRMVHGTDDIVGAEVKEAIFNGGESATMPFHEAAAEVERIAGQRLLWKRWRN
jgi:hypothetical protein